MAQLDCETKSPGRAEHERCPALGLLPVLLPEASGVPLVEWRAEPKPALA
jgi:hypothetical protein